VGGLLRQDGVGYDGDAADSDVHMGYPVDRASGFSVVGSLRPTCQRPTDMIGDLNS
jgi:hypothetical protein